MVFEARSNKARASLLTVSALALLSCGGRSESTDQADMPSPAEADAAVTDPSLATTDGVDSNTATSGGTDADTPGSGLSEADEQTTDAAPEPDTPSSEDDPTRTECSEHVIADKRLIRLSFNQLVNSISALIDPQASAELAARYALSKPDERTFPPLNSPREGVAIADPQWQTSDSIAQDAGQYVFDNFTTVTGCSEAESDLGSCAADYAQDFAQRAFRRPLSDEERTRASALFDELLETASNVQVGTQFFVYAVLSDPRFLYRTEFGPDATSDAALTPHELASLISYFVTDAPPDAALLQSATDGELDDASSVAAHVDRLLGTQGAQDNLTSAMLSYVGIAGLANIVIDPAVAPHFDNELRWSMYHEVELLVDELLWNGELSELITSRTSFVDARVADVYGIDFPPDGAELDDDGFARVALPEFRSGILTAPGFLTTRSRPEGPSVVGRGLLVNSTLVCATTPPPPEEPFEDQLELEALTQLSAATEREKAEFRAEHPTCGGCHALFDPYGLALDNLDVIGAYRDVDPDGRPLDPTVTLPPTVGGVVVSSPAEMARALVDFGTFSACMSRSLLTYALAEGPRVERDSCANQAIVERFEQTDGTFSSLVREVARSRALLERHAGDAQ